MVEPILIWYVCAFYLPPDSLNLTENQDSCHGWERKRRVLYLKPRCVLWFVLFYASLSLGGLALVLSQRELVVRWRSLETAQNRQFRCLPGFLFFYE